MGKSIHHKRDTKKVKVVVGPVTSSTTSTSTKISESTSTNELSRNDVETPAGAENNPSLGHFVPERNDGDSNEKWFRRILRRLNLSNNRRRLDSIDDEDDD